MNKHKNTNKQGEKILLSGIAATTLGLISTKPQIVKADSQNGNRATKKATKRTIKTKLNYQSYYSKTAKKTVGLEASSSQQNDAKAGNKEGSSNGNDIANTEENSSSNSGTNQGKDTNQISTSNTDKAQNTTPVSSENNNTNEHNSTSDSKVTSNKDKDIKNTDTAKVTRSADLYHGLIYNKIPFTYNTDGILTITPNTNELIGTDYERTLSLKNACPLTDAGDFDYNPTLDIKKIVIDGDLTGNIYVRGLFSGFKNLESIVGLGHIDFSNTIDMQSLFQDDPKLKTIDGLNTMNTSKVTDMSGMFQGCNKLGLSENEKDHFNIDISNFDFSNVISLNSMFNDCTNITSLTLPEKINTSKATNMGGMFFACSSLKQLDLSKFDTSNVLSMQMMFKGCQALNYLNISSFDTSKLDENHISGMLQNLPSLNTLVLGKKCILKSGRLDVGLGTDGTWVNVGNGTLEKPEASKKWSSRDLIKNYDSEKDADTYIRYSGGLVTVHYQDQDGNPVLDDSDKPIPDDYLVGNVGQSIPVDTDKKIPGYQIAKDQDFGTFTSDPKIVNVIYNADLGYVNVHYEDENGKPLLDKNGKVIKDSSIKAINGHNWSINPQDKDFQFDGYKLVKTDGKTSGVFDKDNPPTVTLIYTDQGKVIIHYQDENGKPLLDKNGSEIKDSFLQGKFGTGWTIDSNNYKFPGYAFVSIDGKASGIFDKDNTPTVTLVYTDQGKVTIHYRDENGKPLLDKNGKEIDNTILHGKIGQDKWNIDPNDYKFPGYAFVSADGKTSGIFDATNPTVNLVYTDQGKVAIHYQDENGKPLLDKNGKEIKDSFLQGKIGQDKWNIDPNDYKFPGYAFVSADGKTSGIFDATNPTVNLVYTDQGKVAIHYQDENGKPLLDKNGKEIDDTILHGKIDQDKWNIDLNDYKFPGYAFVSADGKTSGIFDATNPTVNLKYTSKAQPIKVHYVDNQGKSISEDRIISGTIGQKIPVEPKEIPGYSVSEINGQKITDKGNITLYLSDKPQEITYTYTQNSSSTPNKAKAPNVTVHYQDEYGNILAPNVVLEGYVGDGYTSETKSISGYTLKTRPNNATGFFTTFPQDVTYIYSKNETNSNQITDKQPDNNKPTKVPTIKKPKRKPTRHLRNINRRKQLDKKSSIPTKLVQRKTITQQANSTNNKHSSSLPQTGKNQHSSLAMLSLGGIALISAFSLAWLDRKKNK